tara:strand:- start:6640 stop:7092 length:453 start_codon:yes stop_codon:yes gene_type:complete
LEQQLKNQAWYESPRERLSLWRQFRKGLDTNDTEQVCKTVVEWWKMAPLSSMTINPVESSAWPTPWEMLHSGDFCENSLALGMSYTIYYANEKIPNELLYITDRNNSTQQLCVWIDNKYLLNYEHGGISTLPTENISISFQKKIADVIVS